MIVVVSKLNVFFRLLFGTNGYLSDIQVKLLKITLKLSHTSIANKIIKYDTLVVPETLTLRSIVYTQVYTQVMQILQAIDNAQQNRLRPYHFKLSVD